MIDRQTLEMRDGKRLAGHAQSGQAEFSRIYAFGDSLSDAGNVYTASAHVLPDPFIYSHGRFTNGPVWVQDLARDLHLPAPAPSLLGGTDFAYGGGEAGAEPLHSLSPLDLPAQLAQFALQDPHPAANALYTLSIGGNDVIDAVPAYAAHPASAVADVQAAVGDELSFIGGLAADGARHFAILNVPDLGKTPEEAGQAAAASTLSALYDSDLSSQLQPLIAADHLSVDLVNTYGLIDQAVANPSAFGLTNVTTPVWTGNFDNPFSGSLNATGSAQNKFLFFDHLHPTETGHMAIAGLALAGLR